MNEIWDLSMISVDIIFYMSKALSFRNFDDQFYSL